MNEIFYKINGKSHDKKMSVEIFGIPKGYKIDLEELCRYVQKRHVSAYSTKRKEDDIPILLRGIDGGVTTGESIVFEVENKDVIKDDYKPYEWIPRPSHADIGAYFKDGKIPSGGGEYSGRLTVLSEIVGGISKQILKGYGVEIFTHISRVGNVVGKSYKDGYFKPEKYPYIDLEDESKFESEIGKISACSDSVGGIVECVVTGVKKGLGGAYFDGVEGLIGKACFAVPAVKGIEFGDGFLLAEKHGSEVLDEPYYDGEEIKFSANHNGGLYGGVTVGQNIAFRVVFKPTPTIGKPVNTVDLSVRKCVLTTFSGRHDACIAPRGALAIESVTAFEILKLYLEQ